MALSGVKEKVLYLGPAIAWARRQARRPTSSAKPLVLDTEMLETSSWGECGNDDLPGDQARFDKASLYFDSEPLPDDLDIFGYPTVALTLAVNRPTASLAMRLCELEPGTGASHLVTYRFFNLAYRGGDMAKPREDRAGQDLHLARAPQHRGPHLQEGLAHQALRSRRRSIRRCGRPRTRRPSRCSPAAPTASRRAP